MREGNSFTLSTPRRGGYPIPRWGGGGGVLLPSSRGWRVPPYKVQVGGDRVPPPIQVRSQDGGWGYPPSRSDPRMGRQGRGTPPPPHPGQIPGRGGGYPLPEQHSMYLLRGGRYASCVYAEGLSCSNLRTRPTYVSWQLC